MRLKNQAFAGNIDKRGKVKQGVFILLYRYMWITYFEIRRKSRAIRLDPF